MLIEQLQRYQEKNTLLENKLHETKKYVIVLKARVEGALEIEQNMVKQLEESTKQKHEEHDESTKTIFYLKIQVEGATRIKEVLTSQLKEKDEIYQEGELEITSLRSELERIVSTNFKCEKSSMILNDIISYQRYALDKTAISYENKKKCIEECESSNLLENKNEEKLRRYENVLISSNHGEGNNKG